MSSSLFASSPNPATTQMQDLAAMYKIYQTSANPMAMLSQAAMNDPRFAKISEQLTSQNQNGREAFYKAAKEQGMSDEQIQQFLNNLKMMLGG